MFRLSSMLSVAFPSPVVAEILAGISQESLWPRVCRIELLESRGRVLELVTKIIFITSIIWNKTFPALQLFLTRIVSRLVTLVNFIFHAF